MSAEPISVKIICTSVPVYQCVFAYLILQCTFGERMPGAPVTFIAVVFRQRFDGSSQILGFSTIRARIGLKPRVLLSAKVRCLKATAMKKASYEIMRRSKSREHLFDCQRTGYARVASWYYCIMDVKGVSAISSTVAFRQR